MTVNNNKKYLLAVGYGDYRWDDGEDHFLSDSLEELWEEINTDLSFEEFMQMMNEDGYAEDDEQMWYVIEKE